MRGFLFGSLLLLPLLAFGACVDSVPAADGSGSDGGASDGAGDGGAGGDGSSKTDGATEGGRPVPTGALQWVFTMDVPSRTRARLTYDDSGNLIFVDPVSGGGSASITVNGQSYSLPAALAVGKISPTGSLTWLKVFDVAVDYAALDVATNAAGDIWILGGIIEGTTGIPAHQNWNGSPIAKISPTSRGDIFFAKIGSDGAFGSAYQIATAGGGLDHSGVNYMIQTMRLSRAGSQMVGAIGHHGNIVLPNDADGGVIPVSASGEAVTVFRADPDTGGVKLYDVYTGSAIGLTPGGISVRPDSNMAVAINVASSSGQTIGNSRGGVSFSQTGAGTGTNPSGAYSWFVVAQYSPADGVALAQPFNQDGDNSAGHTNLVEASSVSLSSTGDIEVTGHFNASAAPMNGVTFTSLGAEDSFMMTLSPTGSVVRNPIIGTVNDDGFANAAFDPWNDLAATSVYAGTINILRSTESASGSNAGISQFKMLSDGGTSWNFGAFTNQGSDPFAASAIAVDPASGNEAFGGTFSGTSDLGKGMQSVPHSGSIGLFIIQRAP